MFDMIAACQAEVDPSSRMCRVDDIQLTTVIPSGLPTVDQNGNPIAVPEIIPETDEEKELFAGALRRRQLRLVLANKMKPADATELKSLFKDVWR